MDREQMDHDPVVVGYNEIRRQIKDVAAELKLRKTGAALGGITIREGEDRNEVVANLTLAYRHLEDASMRIGKAIQARDGGVSVYDKATVVGA